MIPIVWRFLLGQYFKVTGLCVAAFIAVLLTMRLEEIAHFASLDPSIGLIIQFILFQIPYILPVALPVACLISALLLVQRLSRSHELTALRSCGLAIKDFLAPILLSGALLMMVNLYVVSELATASHFLSSLWKEELRSINPLLLLRNKHLMRVKGGYFDAMGSSKMGESAEKVVLALPNASSRRLSLFLAEELTSSDNLLQGKKASFITTHPDQKSEKFDHLLIENIEEVLTGSRDFAQLMQQNVWKINNDYLPMSLLFSRLHEEKQSLRAASVEEQRKIQETIDSCYLEMVRRFSVAFAVFSFTLMGASFGMNISRTPSSLKTFYVIALAALFLAGYFLAKGIEDQPLLAAAYYLVPHTLIISWSLLSLRRVSLGIEHGWLKSLIKPRLG